MRRQLSADQADVVSGGVGLSRQKLQLGVSPLLGCHDLTGVAQVAVTQLVEVEWVDAHLIEAFRNDDRFARDVAGWIPAPNLDAARPCEGELAVVVFSSAGVLGLLDDNDLVTIHLTSHGNRGRQAGVAGRSALEAFDLGEKLGHVEDLALGH